MYYSYHNYLKSKIKKIKIDKIEYFESYKNLGKVMIIYFKDGTKYPIREYAWYLYKDLI